MRCNIRILCKITNFPWLTDSCVVWKSKEFHLNGKKSSEYGKIFVFQHFALFNVLKYKRELVWFLRDGKFDCQEDGCLIGDHAVLIPFICVSYIQGLKLQSVNFASLSPPV